MPGVPTVVNLSQTPEVSFTKEVVGVPGTEVGQFITYLFTVTNDSAVAVLTNAMFTDAAVGLVNQPVTPSTLNPGESGTYTFNYLITQADVDAGVFSNQAIASVDVPVGPTPVFVPSDDPNNPGGPGAENPTDVPFVQMPDFTFEKTAVFTGGTTIASNE